MTIESNKNVLKLKTQTDAHKCPPFPSSCRIRVFKVADGHRGQFGRCSLLHGEVFFSFSLQLGGNKKRILTAVPCFLFSAALFRRRRPLLVSLSDIVTGDVSPSSSDQGRRLRARQKNSAKEAPHKASGSNLLTLFDRRRRMGASRRALLNNRRDDERPRNRSALSCND